MDPDLLFAGRRRRHEPCRVAIVPESITEVLCGILHPTGIPLPVFSLTSTLLPRSGYPIGRRRRCSWRKQRKGQPEQGRHHLDQEEDECRAQTLLVRGIWSLPCSCRRCQSFSAVENAPVKQGADILASHPILWASTAAPPEPRSPASCSHVQLKLNTSKFPLRTIGRLL